MISASASVSSKPLNCPALLQLSRWVIFSCGLGTFQNEDFCCFSFCALGWAFMSMKVFWEGNLSFPQHLVPLDISSTGFLSYMFWELISPVQLPGVSWGGKRGGPTPCSSGRSACLLQSLPVLCCFTQCGLFQGCVCATPTHFDGVLLSSVVGSSLSSVQVIFRGKWCIGSCRVSVSIGEGALRTSLCCCLVLQPSRSSAFGSVSFVFISCTLSPSS